MDSKSVDQKHDWNDHENLSSSVDSNFGFFKPPGIFRQKNGRNREIFGQTNKEHDAACIDQRLSSYVDSKFGVGN